MDMLSTKTLSVLAERTGAPCVSLFLPVGRGSYDQRSAKLELKDLVSMARTGVREMLRPHEADALFARAEALLTNDAEWSDLARGMGFFLAPNVSHIVLLPATVEPVAMIGDRFDVLPLVPLLQPDIAFHVLVLSRNHVKVYRGTRYTFKEADVPGLPRNLDDDLWYEEHSNALISHGGPRMGSSRQPTSVVHGGESWRDERKEMFERFAQHVDDALEPAIFTSGAPLVIAAAEREASFFRSASRHPKLLNGALLGNPDDISTTELHDRAWQIVHDEVILRHRSEVLARFHELAHAHRSSIDATKVYEAAYSGRIDTVLIPETNSQAPRYSPHLAGGVDNFVNDIVLQTLSHGGLVEVVPAAGLGEGVSVAAIFRWADYE